MNTPSVRQDTVRRIRDEIDGRVRALVEEIAP